MRSKLKMNIASACAALALFAGAAPASAATATSIKTGKPIVSQPTYIPYEYNFIGEATCRARKTTVDEIYKGKWEGGIYASTCTSYIEDNRCQRKRWMIQVKYWVADKGGNVPYSVPAQASATDAAIVSLSC